MDWYVNIGIYLWSLLKLWLTTLFVAPFKTMDMLWLLIPVWIGWFFAEFFQEKIGTSMGNAITNSVVVLWGSIDCTRQTMKLLKAGELAFGLDVMLRFSIIAVIFAYGMLIVFLGIEGKKIIKKIARIRVVTYAFVIFAPIFYNELPLTLDHIAAALLFFPIFYFFIELIDWIMPNPKAIEEDIEESKEEGMEKGDDLLGSESSFEKELGDLKL